jgi:hypothetical protein
VAFKPRSRATLEHIHTYGLEKVRVEAFADFFLRQIEFMDMLLLKLMIGSRPFATNLNVLSCAPIEGGFHPASNLEPEKRPVQETLLEIVLRCCASLSLPLCF